LQQVLKARLGSEGIESGIDADVGHPIGSLSVSLFEKTESPISPPLTEVDKREVEAGHMRVACNQSPAALLEIQPIIQHG